MQLLFAALVFLIIFLIGAAVFVFQAGPKQGEIIRGRLEAIQKGAAFTKTALDMNLIRDELLSTIPALNKMLVRWSWPTRLRNFIAQAGMEMKPGKLVLVCVVTGLMALELTGVIYGNWGLAVLVGVPAAFLPLVFVAIKRTQRMAAFERLFPEVIELLSRSVRAGHSFSAGMEIVSTDLGEPASTEFRVAFDEQRFGLPMRDALLNLCDRVPLVDVRLFVIALLVQKETGGNLAEILDNLAHVIRERFRIAGEVRVRTAQGRLTAAILILLPVVMLVVMRVLDPGYVRVLFVERLGHLMLMGAVLLQAVGAMIVWRIVKIKV